jgi:hypothetical protein
LFKLELLCASENDLTTDQFKLNPTMNVSSCNSSLRLPLNMKPARRAHNRRRACVLQSQGLRFSRFSQGIESGSTEELEILKEFIRRKCGEKRLRDKLHAIWFVLRVVMIATTDDYFLRYCVPMDNQRPGLDLKFYKDICPDPEWCVVINTS